MLRITTFYARCADYMCFFSYLLPHFAFWASFFHKWYAELRTQCGMGPQDGSGQVVMGSHVLVWPLKLG